MAPNKQTATYALPELQKYRLDSPEHVRASTRALESNKAKTSRGQYRRASRALSAAAKKFGIDSKKPADDTPRAKTVRVRAELGKGGSLHIRHLTLSEKIHACHARGRDGDRECVALILAAKHDDLVELRTPCGLLRSTDAGEDGKPVWIQLAKQGTFRGHSAGPFQLDLNTFADIVRNFKASENKRIPIDFEHASEADPTEGNIAAIGAPAQGWIVDMAIRDGDLWGLVDWGPLAREYIRTGKYRFFSPALRFNSKDRVTGANIGTRMTSGGLTNNPFLDGMQPLAAKDAGDTSTQLSATMCYSANEVMPAIRSALRVHELSTAAECSDHLDRLRDHLDAVGGDHEAMHEGIKLADFLKPLRDIAGGKPGDTWDDVLERVQAVIDAATDAHEAGLQQPSALVAPMDDDEGGGDSDEAAMRDLDARVRLLNARTTNELRIRGA